MTIYKEEAMRKLLTSTMRKLWSFAIRTLKMLATVVLSFSLLPIRVAVVESRWVAGRSLGQQPGDDIDRDIDSFDHRDSGSPQNQDARGRCD